ncbi:MAG: DUF2069 domain-containing protein [Pseudoxanthomonas sp.]
MTTRRLLVAALIALAALYAAWFRADKHLLASLIVFVAPPLLLAAGVAAGAKRAPFWAGVLALFWFCHGVMAAWSRPAEAAYAWLEIALSLLVVLASNWPGLRARFGKRSRTP